MGSRKSGVEAAKRKVEASLEALTAKVVAQMESDPGRWTKPWREALGGGIPVNVVSRKRYQGGNVFILGFAASERGWGNVWGTYKQWESLGGQVRRGEKGEVGLFWRTFTVTERKDGKESEKTIPYLRSFTVFNSAQVEGGDEIVARRFGVGEPREAVDPIEEAEAFFAALGSEVRFAPGGAYYHPDDDYISLPAIADFRDAVSYYGTLAHEHVHWTGHPSRLDRLDKKARFGNEPYAREELVAELGSVFLGAHLGLEIEPRPDHAQYLRSWINVLKEDPKALWNALSHASRAYEHLVGSPAEAESEEEEAA